jgi:hypothetical protein
VGIRFSLGLLLALLVPMGDPTGEWTLAHVSPATLETVGPQLHVRLDPDNFHAFDTRSRLVVVRTRNALKVFDQATLHLVRSYPFRARDVCAVGLDGAAPVALVGCKSQTSRRYAVVRFDPAPVRIPVGRLIAAIRYPVSMAFGDGHAYVVHAFGAVDAIDLRSGTVTSHAPKRTLAKGEGYLKAAWLGDHLLALGGTVVDVRMWVRRTLGAHATETVAGGDRIATVGPNGVNVYAKRDLRLYRRLFRGEVIDSALLDGDVLYAQSALVWYVVDVPTGRTIARLVPDVSASLQLLGGES